MEISIKSLYAFHSSPINRSIGRFFLCLVGICNPWNSKGCRHHLFGKHAIYQSGNSQPGILPDFFWKFVIADYQYDTTV